MTDVNAAPVSSAEGIVSPLISRSPSTVEVPEGRWKAPPVCVDASLKESSMDATQLAKLAFDAPVIDTIVTAAVVRNHSSSEGIPTAIPVSSSSSTCTRESDLSDAESKDVKGVVAASTKDMLNVKSTTAKNNQKVPSNLDHTVSERLNAKVALRKTSRQGRNSQRWIHADSAEPVRLVTGCVPILRDGKILFVSASRKSEWILPKGGWETDESIEESAVREAYEEAGVLGTLGPPLGNIQYETRKSKKRRLEKDLCLSSLSSTPNHVKVKEETSEDINGSNAEVEDTSVVPVAVDSVPKLSESKLRIAWPAPKVASKSSSDETASVASERSSVTYSEVRMTYVSSLRFQGYGGVAGEGEIPKSGPH